MFFSIVWATEETLIPNTISILIYGNPYRTVLLTKEAQKLRSRNRGITVATSQPIEEKITDTKDVMKRSLNDQFTVQKNVEELYMYN
jgi:hypothetical protein